MGMGMGGPSQVGFDATAAFKNEREALGISAHDWVAEKAERELLGDMYPDSSTDNEVDLSKLSMPEVD